MKQTETSYCRDTDCFEAGMMHKHPTVLDHTAERLAKAAGILRELTTQERTYWLNEAHALIAYIQDDQAPRYPCAREGCEIQDEQSAAYTLSGGYGSTILDCEPDLYFCSLQCLREWVTTGWAKDITQ